MRGQGFQWAGAALRRVKTNNDDEDDDDVCMQNKVSLYKSLT